MSRLVSLLFFLTLGLAVTAQVRPEREVMEEKSQKSNELKERFNNIPPQENNDVKSDDRKTSNNKSKSKKSKKKKKTGKSKSGKNLTIQKNTKDRDKAKTFNIYQGEKIVIKTKDGEVYKGVLSNIQAPKFSVGDSVLELNEIKMVKRGFLPILKKRSSGLGLFVGGAAVTGGGTYLGYVSTLVFELGGPFIIVTAMGITTAIGIDIVGVSIAGEGVKLMAERVKWKIGDKWKVSLN